MRKERVLGGKWDFFKGCSDKTSLAQLEPVAVTVPHTWNSVDGQDGGNDYYRGICCYRKHFPCPAFFKSSQELYIEFGGVNSSADVYFNDVRVCLHDGGYSAFQVRIDHLLKDENELLVFVDNSPNDSVYPQTADFTFYGGIYRDVKLICVEDTHFEFTKYGGKGVILQTSVEDGTGILKIQAKVSGRYERVLFSVSDGVSTVAKGEGTDIEIRIPSVRLWNGLEDPFLYKVKAEIHCGNFIVDSLEYEVGFRFFTFDAEKGFFLNGRSYPLRGVSRHQDREGVGNALTKKMHEEDLSLILEVGANSIRLAHYQHDQYFYELCDKAGLVCWAEIPYITKHLEAGFQNTMDQLSELIEQCIHHCSIVCWGISNEITAGGNSEGLYMNNKALYDRCHEMDCTRPVAMAHAFMLPVNDKVVTLPDIAGYNLYYGWYLGNMDGNGFFLDTCHKAHPELPIGLTEFGCDANIKLQSSNPTKGDYSEQYQALFHEFMCSEIDKRPYLWGTYIWNMFDFAADARDEGGTRGRNCKGLVTFDRKIRKDAFFAVKAWYSKEPFIHICGKRYVNRCEDFSEVKVYSNQKEVELFCNGKSIGKKKGEHVFVFNVKLSERNEIRAVCGDLSDTIRVRKVQKPDSSYVLASSSEIRNWFEGLQLISREGFMSVHDTVGDILETADGKNIFEDVMALRKSNVDDDIASQVKIPIEMMLMTMKDVPLSEILRRSRIPDGVIRRINGELNKIHKEKI
jgi:beta-galactosidase